MSQREPCVNEHGRLAVRVAFTKYDEGALLVKKRKPFYTSNVICNLLKRECNSKRFAYSLNGEDEQKQKISLFWMDEWMNHACSHLLCRGGCVDHHESTALWWHLVWINNNKMDTHWWDHAKIWNELVIMFNSIIDFAIRFWSFSEISTLTRLTHDDTWILCSGRCYQCNRPSRTNSFFLRHLSSIAIRRFQRCQKRFFYPWGSFDCTTPKISTISPFQVDIDPIKSVTI